MGRGAGVSTCPFQLVQAAPGPRLDELPISGVMLQAEFKLSTPPIQVIDLRTNPNNEVEELTIQPQKDNLAVLG